MLMVTTSGPPAVMSSNSSWNPGSSRRVGTIFRSSTLENSGAAFVFSVRYAMRVNMLSLCVGREGIPRGPGVRGPPTQESARPSAAGASRPERGGGALHPAAQGPGPAPHARLNSAQGIFPTPFPCARRSVSPPPREQAERRLPRGVSRMAPNGVVLHPAWPARRASPRRRVRRSAEALLEGIETLQRATKLSELTERAALEALPLTGAAAAVVYLEVPEAGPYLAVSGAIDRPAADARAGLVRELLPGGPATPYLLLGNGGTMLVARFCAGAVRGVVLAERRSTGFEDADGWVLTAFACHLGAAAAVLSTPERLRQARRLRGGPADAVARFSAPRAEEGRAARPVSADPLFGLADVIGRSTATAAVRELAGIAAPSSSSLLIEGESGVGKEVLAQAVHSTGPRRERPFIAVHCAAIPRELLESELFGYEPGAFTGASPHGHAGKFEMAEGGTLLLDDIVELPLDMQAKLLRALQERAVTRLGGSRPRPVNARIVATANRPLRAAADSGAFRPDLFYRLNVLHIVIPPLREQP